MPRTNRTAVQKVFQLSLGALCAFGSLTACNKDDDDDLSKADILSSTRWKTTVVKDSVGVDVTAANTGFVGLATYNRNGTYEFFNLDGTPRGDSGYWALTADESKRILYSLTRSYTRVVDIVELRSNLFTYKTVANGKTVWVEHVPL
ncbi:DUF4822 domain-containing protein [Paraflavisolibacter sp. H34]|uniref:DUF4822 domain-containing protein n=1 Tax=Huijunlia imazamoxiresistens TaxID=3127457 RepID=UPI00301A29CB